MRRHHPARPLALALAVALLASGSVASTPVDPPGQGEPVENQALPTDIKGPFDRRAPGLQCDALAATESTGCHTWLTDYDRNGTVKDPQVLERGHHGERVFVAGTTDGFRTQDASRPYLAALDASTGDVLWGWSTRGPGGAHDSEAILDVVASPDGDRVYATGYVRDADGDSIARTWGFDAATGDTLWSRTDRALDSGDDWRSGEALEYTHQDWLLLATVPDPVSLQALDPGTGHELWNITDVDPLRAVCEGCLQVAPSENLALVGGRNGTTSSDAAVAAVDLGNRSVRWVTAAGGPGGGFGLFGDLEVSPGQDLVFTASTQGLFDRSGWVTAREIDSGEVVWSRDVPGSYPAVHLTSDEDRLVLTGSRQTGLPFDSKAWVGGIDAGSGDLEWSWTHEGLGREVSDTDGGREGFSLPGREVSVVAVRVDAGVDGDDDVIFASVDESTGETVQTVRYSRVADAAEAVAGYRHVERGDEAAFAAVETWPVDGPTRTTVLRYELDRFVPEEGVCVEGTCVPEALH